MKKIATILLLSYAVSVFSISLHLALGGKAILLLKPTPVFAADEEASNVVSFTIENPKPTITSISPSSVLAGNSDVELDVIGSDFITDSTVNFSGSPKQTTFISSNKLTALIPSSDIKTAGSYDITVTNPSPGGGTSPALSLTVGQKQEPVFPNTVQEPTDSGETGGVMDAIQSFANNLFGTAKEAVQLLQPIRDNTITYTAESIKATKKAIETPAGSVATTAVATTGAAVAATAIFSMFDLFLIPIRLWGILLTLLGIRKKSLSWGVVYDSVTKQPLDPSYITLKDIRGKIVDSAITDIDGRYGFLAAPGIYTIVARKTNYSFPSRKLKGLSDEIYNNLYFGEKIEIKKKGEVISKNIPLDPLKFDWNEFAKRDRNYMKFYSRWDMFIRKISNPFFIIGFITSTLVLFLAPSPYNIIIFGVYIALLILKVVMRALGLKPKTIGYITDRKTGVPLSFAVLRIISPSTNTEISHKVSDAYGRYYCLVPKGKYYVKIEQKSNDGSYSGVYQSSLIDASRNGIIKEKFKV